MDWVDMKISILEIGDYRSSAGGGLEHSTEEWWEGKSLGMAQKLRIWRLDYILPGSCRPTLASWKILAHYMHKQKIKCE